MLRKLNISMVIAAFSLAGCLNGGGSTGTGTGTGDGTGGSRLVKALGRDRDAAGLCDGEFHARR